MSKKNISEIYDATKSLVRGTGAYSAVFSGFRENPYVRFLTTIGYLNLLVLILDVAIAVCFDDNVVRKAVSVLFLMIAMASIFMFGTAIKYQEQIRNLVENCDEINGPTNIHVKVFGRKIREKAFEDSQLATTMIFRLAVLALFGTAVIGALFNFLTNATSYPLPNVGHIFMLPPTSPWSYLGNLIHQILGNCLVNLNCYFIASLGITFMIFIVAQLDTTIVLVREWAVISEEESFEEWVGLITESMVKVKVMLQDGRDGFDLLLYYIEKVTYAALLVSFTVWQTQPSLVGATFPGMAVAIVMLAVAVCNNMIENRFECLNQALYDIPWYELKPQQRRDLKLLIQNSQKPILISAGGIMDLTLSWFSDVVKKAYSGALILKDFAS